jgi:hypothetical protein
MKKLFPFSVAALSVLSASPAFAGEPDRTIWACNGINVEMVVDYEESSMGADDPQNVVTFNFENPPAKKFTLKVTMDHEGPLYWGVELNGEACDKTLN